MAELNQQLGYLRAELNAERTAHEKVRDNLSRVQKNATDMQLLTHSPVRGGGKKAEEELKRKESAIETLEKSLEQIRKQELDTVRKQAGQVDEIHMLKTKLETSQQKVRNLVGETMSVMDALTKLETSLGMSRAGMKQSSKEVRNRLSKLTETLRQAAGHEAKVRTIEREMIRLRAKLEDADVETLFAKHGEDQQVLLKMSNTTVSSVRMAVHKLRSEIVRLQKSLPAPRESAADGVLEDEKAQACWDILGVSWLLNHHFVSA